MTGQTLKFEIKINYPIFFGLTFLAHFLLFFLLNAPTTPTDQAQPRVTRTPLKIQSLGEKDSKILDSVFIKKDKPAAPSIARKAAPKHLNLSDLMASPSSPKATVKTEAPKSLRPGELPKQTTALSGLKYGTEDFKKMANDPMIQGGADILTSQRVALNFEVPKGKNLDELNESELKLYGFLRRGAMKYVASLSSEIKEFEMKNPHLHFPLTDTKQVLTGRLVYDGHGNLKQIKMVRWTNIDKLQTFFERVLGRLDTLQNPPKELWSETGEFTVFVTLQING